MTLDAELSRLADAICAGDADREALIASSEERHGAWPELNAFISSEVERSDADGPLAGVPVAIKDNICTTGAPTRCASQILGDFQSFYDAEVITRLRRAGATLYGRTNMDEFAMGSSGENSSFGATRNPWDPGVSPGGSSSGSAAAVAAGIVPAALGSDTGGSIRQPAAFCGVVGMKPTYGRVSRRGLVAFGSSLDQIGPFARTVKDAATVYQAIAGHDAGDSTSSPEPVGDVFACIDDGVAGLRIGIPDEYFAEGLDDEVRDSVMAAARKLEQAGATLVPVSLPHTEYGVAAYYIVATAEASSNLSRFDGVRYGHRNPDATDIESLYARSRAEGFGQEVVRRILLGTFVLCSGYYDAYYRRAQQVRTLVIRDFVQAWDSCDILLTPTTPTPAFRLGKGKEDALQLYLADIYTVTANLAGIPGISVPSSLSTDGLPIGLQLLAPSMREDILFRAAQTWESLRGEFPMPSAEAYRSKVNG